MILLDAYAFVAFLSEEPAAAEVEALLLDDERPAGIPLVNLCEAIDVCARTHGILEDELRAAVEPILAERLTAVDHTYEHVWRAARYREGYYDRNERALSLADCLLLAAAGSDDSVASADSAVAYVARAEGIDFIPLADSAGNKP